MPFYSGEEREQFQQRFHDAEQELKHVGNRELCRRIVALGFSPAVLQEAGHDFWTFDGVERSRERLREASSLAKETAEALRVAGQKLEELNAVCGDHLDVLGLGLDAERRGETLIGQLPELRRFVQMLEHLMIPVYRQHTNRKGKGSFDSADAVLAFMDGCVRYLQVREGKAAKGDWQALRAVLEIARDALPPEAVPIPGAIEDLGKKVRRFAQKFPRLHAATQRMAERAVTAMTKT